MSNDWTTSQPRASRTGQTFQQLQQTLAELLAVSPDEITPSRRFDGLIPPAQRRRGWQALEEAGFALPALKLPKPVFVAISMTVLLPVTLLALFLRNWSVLLSLAELGLLARRVTRPWAVQPPVACETVREATLHLTPFTREDYQAGLWPREEVAAKVRWIVSRAVGVPFESVTDETQFLDLGC